MRVVYLTVFLFLIDSVFASSLVEDTTVNLRQDINTLRGTVLDVTECSASSPDQSFVCDKLGYFVNGFQQQAIYIETLEQAMERVPTHGVNCCRPTIPTLEDMLSTDVSPVSVVSIGCHVAVNRLASNMACESSGNSLVTGFVDSFTSTGSQEMAVPAKGVSCCTPVLLLSSGEAWELERCNCQSTNNSHSVNCEEGKLLWGYPQSEEVSNHDVPVAPPQCCDLCLGQAFDMDECSHHHKCNDNGVCIMGECECFADWIGADCGVLKSEYFEEPELHSSVWWLGGLGFIGAFFCLFATFWIIRRTEQPDLPISRTPPDHGFLNLLNSYMNDAGSAGATDSGSDHEENRQEEDQERPQTEEENKKECYQPLLQMNCCICETRPVQVTLVPCGHSNLCRKCSRKLNNCPFCRQPIFRRQRLFLSVDSS